MKRLFLQLLIALTIVSFSSCENENKVKLMREITAADRMCPVNLGMMGDMLSLKYDKETDEVQLYFSLNEDLINIDELKSNEQMLFRSMKLSFSKGESREMLKLMMKAGAKLSVVYKSASTGKTIKVAFTFDDLKDILDNPMSERDINQMLLENQLEMENSRCPYLVGEGMEMVKVYDDGDCIVYSCRIYENIYEVSILEYTKMEIKENICEVFKDPVVSRELSIFASLDKGLKYNYYGDQSGESVDIIFTIDELNRYLK